MIGLTKQQQQEIISQRSGFQPTRRVVAKELEEKEIGLETTDAVREYLGEKGFDPVLGARPLRRLIQNEVEDALSDALLSGNINAGDIAVVDMDNDGKILVTAKSEEPAASPA